MAVEPTRSEPPLRVAAPRPATSLRFVLPIVAFGVVFAAMRFAAKSASPSDREADSDTACAVGSPDVFDSAASRAEPVARFEPVAGLAWARVSPEQVADAKRAGVVPAFENPLGMRFVRIPAGSYRAGSPAGEDGRSESERQRDVRVDHAFFLATTEVTNAQFRRFQPSHDSGSFASQSLDQDEMPVASVSPADAEAFLTWLNEKDPGHGYRLPTEAEWERAARGGTQSAYWWGASAADAARHANLADASASRACSCTWGVKQDDGFAVASPVGSYDPNPFGLYDVLGNVFEFCAADDAPLGALAQVARGGSWNECARGIRAAHRCGAGGGARLPFIGFRVAASSPAAP